jgi:hypothetical protein
MWGAHWTIDLEKRGIPCVYVVDEPFVEDVKISLEKEGMPALRTVVVSHPCGAVPDEQYPTIIPKLVESLTAPLTEKEKRDGVITRRKPSRIAMAGTLDEIQDYFNSRHFSDGLPVIPPTEEKVATMLKSTHHAPDEIVTTSMFPENYTVTVEKVAIVGVLAGCNPEYMPVLLAAIEAFSKGYFESVVRSTGGFAFPMVVNGPIRNEIGMNYQGNAMGPGNRANATIGRFLRMAIINLGGSWPGINDLSIQGNPTKYTFCFAENEEASPWEPFHVSMGYQPTESTISIFSGCWSLLGHTDSLDIIAQGIAKFPWRNGAIVLIDPGWASELKKQGLNKEDVEEYVWSHAVIPMKEFRSEIHYKYNIEPILKGAEMYGDKYIWPKSYLDLPDEAIVQAYPRKYVKVIVVGSGIGMFGQAWKASHPSITGIDKWR